MDVALFVIVALAVYFLPTIVAWRRQHQSETAIMVLNLFLGWTFLGWLIALVWACTGNTKANAENNAAMVAEFLSRRGQN
jgi:hypothetical protein